MFLLLLLGWATLVYAVNIFYAGYILRGKKDELGLKSEMTILFVYAGETHPLCSCPRESPAPMRVASLLVLHRRQRYRIESAQNGHR